MLYLCIYCCCGGPAAASAAHFGRKRSQRVEPLQEQIEQGVSYTVVGYLLHDTLLCFSLCFRVYLGCCQLLLDRAALKACLSCHILCIVSLIVLICFLDHMVRWSLGMLSGCDQQSFAALFCLAVAVSGQSCRKCHRVSDIGWPWLRQKVHAFRMHTSVGR